MKWAQIYEGVIVGTKGEQRAMLVTFSYRVHICLMTDYGWLALEETTDNVDAAREIVEQIFGKD